MFVRNAWYAAAWVHDIRTALHAVTMLGEEIVLFRKRDGSYAALENACAHRKLPLSMGRLKDDQIECGYHGLMFDCSGACTKVPGEARIPKAARVRSYPVEERYGLLWVWMGEAALADPQKIVRADHWGDPAWGTTRGDSMIVDCNYLYITDNLLDPSHVAWVHQTSFGTTSCEDTPLKTEESAEGLVVSRWMFDEAPAPFYAPFLKFSGKCDRLQAYEVRYPSHAITRATFVPAGSGGDGKPLHADAFLMDSFNFLTPIDENRTRYFWFQMRNVAPNDAAVSERFATSVRAAFEEDRAILAAVHRGMASSTTPSIALAIDRGPQYFRRGIAKLIAAESPAVRAAE